MRLLKWLAGVFAVYVVFVLLFEAVYLGMYQPSFESRGIPMLVLETTDESGESNARMLARFETEGRLYVSAHHWTRGWYKRAVEHPNVRVDIDGKISNYTAVAVEGEEFDRVAAGYPLPFVARFLMGFPLGRDILRLDPVNTGSDSRGPG